jgi:hypothetical protein
MSTTDSYQPISPAPRHDLESEEDSTNLIGDDPNATKEVLEKQALEDQKKKEERERKAVQEAIDRNMRKQQIAIQNTMREIMTGKVPKEEEGEK